MIMPSHEILSEIFDYNAKTGAVSRRRKTTGRPVKEKRCRYLSLKNCRLATVRVAWVLGWGKDVPLPKKIYARDGDITNTSLENLSDKQQRQPWRKKKKI
jgi:hypothetical protein